MADNRRELMQDKQQKRHIDLPPSPASLIESLRAVGYSIETAVADIVDNSITAKAKNIDIRFSWNAGSPWLAVIDDGEGMSRAELIEAMRLGNISPLDLRDKNDLGRFGLGLKTASFSQCRRLTVLTKEGGEPTACQWDLDHVVSKRTWELNVFSGKQLVEQNQLWALYQEYLPAKNTGTIVHWNCLDRIDQIAIKGRGEMHFDLLLSDVKKHLELVFHRFLAPSSADPGLRKIQIRCNGNELKAFDPFNTKKSTELHDEYFLCERQRVNIQPYLLPHHNKTAMQEYKNFAGDEGYLQNQGFYVYRNRRLIIKGTWFKLLPKIELTKLLRVRVDIPNTLDHMWKIDVKKSSAYPPESIHSELKRIVGRIEVAGKKVYRQRGHKLLSAVKTPAWTRRAVNETICYEINRQHPLVQKILDEATVEQKHRLTDLFQLFEGEFPVDMFFHDFASSPEQLICPRLEEDGIQRMLEDFIVFWGLNAQSSAEQIEELLQVDPFASNRALTVRLLSAKGIK